MASPVRGCFQVGTLLASIALLVAGCGPVDLLRARVDSASKIESDVWAGAGSMLLVGASFENLGNAPVHVLVDALQISGEQGSRGTVREFLNAYRLQRARADEAESRRPADAAVAKAGISGDEIRALLKGQLEVLPGETVQYNLPFLLRDVAGETHLLLHFAYHDDGSDRIARVSLPVRLTPKR